MASCIPLTPALPAAVQAPQTLRTQPVRWHLEMALCRGQRQPTGRKVFPEPWRLMRIPEVPEPHCSLDFSAGSTPPQRPEQSEARMCPLDHPPALTLHPCCASCCQPRHQPAPSSLHLRGWLVGRPGLVTSMCCFPSAHPARAPRLPALSPRSAACPPVTPGSPCEGSSGAQSSMCPWQTPSRNIRARPTAPPRCSLEVGAREKLPGAPAELRAHSLVPSPA